MGNIPSRSPYPSQFITLLRSIMAVSGLIQDKPVKKHKLSSTFCSFTPCFPLLSFVLSNEATIDQSLSFLQRHPSSPWSDPHRLARSGLLRPDSRLWDCPRHSDVGLISRMAALSPCSGSRHLAVSPLPLLLGRLLALQSVSSPYSQYRHFAVSLLALLLVPLNSASQPSNQPHRLVVDLVTLLLAPSPCSC